MNKLLFALLVATALPATARAGDVALTSNVFVEKAVIDASGKHVDLVAPKLVVPGDRLVFVLEYRNAASKPATNFVVTNPVPPSVVFGGAESPGATVSVDGGKTWGALAALKVKSADGNLRPARDDDVTHVRWAMAQPIAVGGGGKLSFRGTVR